MGASRRWSTTSVRVLLARAVFAAVLVVFAEDAAAEEPSKKVFQLDQTVVTATRTAEQVKDVPANVTVLTKEDVQQSAAQTVDDFLREVPGFSLLRQSSSLVANPTTQSVSLRGLGGTSASRTLVLLDGVPLNDPFGGWVYWDKVPLETIERVEVVRGGGSPIWGNLALGGVINIITVRPQERTVQLTTEGGNHGTANMTLIGSDLLGPLGVSVAGNYFNTDGYDVVRQGQRGSIDQNSSSEHKTFSGKLEYAVSPSALAYLYGSYYKEDRDNGTPFQGNSTELGYIRTGTDLTTEDGSSWQLTVFSNFDSFKTTNSSIAPDRNSETPALDQFDVPSTAAGASLLWTKSVFGTHRLTAGTDLYWIEGEDDEDSRFMSGHFTLRRFTGGQQLLDGVYVQDVFTPIDRLQVNLSGRVDLWRSFDGFRQDRNLQSGQITSNVTFPNKTDVSFNPSLGLLYRLTDSASLRGSVYHAFRAPTVNELYRPFRAQGNVINEANADLDPERLLGGEIGGDYAISDTFLGRLTGFWNEVDDSIIQATIGEAGSTSQTIPPCGLVPAGGVCRERENVGRLRTRGIEAEMQFHPQANWTLSTSYLFDDTDIVSAPNQPQLEGKQARQAPEHQVVARVNYTNPSLANVSVQGRYIGDRFEDDLNSLKLNAFFVVDLKLSRQILPGWEAFVGVENLFDKTFEVNRATNGLVEVGNPLLLHGGFRLQF